MKLRPFANVFALRHPDPAMRAKLTAAMRASGRFSEVWQPAPSWICGVAPLPEGEPDSSETRARGLVFTEGRDTLMGDVSAQPTSRLDRVAELARNSPGQLAQLAGDFGFFQFREDGSAVAVRSCGGWVPVYEHAEGETVAFGTRLDDFALFLPTEPKLDLLVVAIFAGKPCFPDRRTMLVGVKLVSQGCALHVPRTGSVETIRYWNPPRHSGSRHSAAVEREHAEELRRLLLRALERDLLPDGGNLLWLSGGVDSCAMGALAAGAARKPVWTWSLLPSREESYREEMSYIEPLAKQFGFSRRWEVRFERDTRNQMLASAPPTIFPQLPAGMGDMVRVLREAPVKVVFGGEFADEVCGSFCTVPDWVHLTPLHGVLAQVVSGDCVVKDVARWFKHRWREASGQPMMPFAVELPDFIHPNLRAEYAVWHERRRRAAANEPAPWRYLALRLECDDYAPMNWEGASALGLRRSFPFLQREVIELAFTCHPAELIRPGHKRMLHCALSKDVPAVNLHRKDKGAWGIFMRYNLYQMSGPLPANLAHLIRPDWHPLPPASLEYFPATRLAQFANLDGHFSACLAVRIRLYSRN